MTRNFFICQLRIGREAGQLKVKVRFFIQFDIINQNMSNLLNQSKADNDWNRPQLAHGQRHLLLKFNECHLKFVQVKQVVLMEKNASNQPKNSRETVIGGIRQTRKLFQVVGWQIFFNQTESLLQDVMIIEDPLRGKVDPASRFG